jgi:hypothetical protein
VSWEALGGECFEDALLAQIDLENLLAALPESRRVMMELLYRLREPDDWVRPWPPTIEEVGDYIGRRFEGVPLSEATIRYRRNAVLAQWRALLAKDGR